MVSYSNHRIFCKISYIAGIGREMSAATSFSLPARLAANFYRTRVIAFSSVTVDPSRERGAHPFVECNFSRSCLSSLPDIPRRHTPRVVRVTWHVSDERRRIMHVSHAWCVAAAPIVSYRRTQLYFLFSCRWLHRRWCGRPARNPWIVPLRDYFFPHKDSIRDMLILWCSSLLTGESHKKCILVLK